MRRLHVAWLLSLLLVLAQTGAVLHELGHLGNDGHTSGAALHAQQPGHAGTCPTCESFSQLANPASGAAPGLAVAHIGLLSVPAPSHAIVDAEALTPRSRGPPPA